jgi:16S rRNA processing protein RimM
MKKEDCFYLGKIVKPFSFKGELVLFLDVDNIENYIDMEFVYLEIKDKLIKYEINNLRLQGNKMVCQFKDVTQEESNMLIGKEMYMPLEFLPKLSGNKFYFHEVIGFNVEDKEKGNIGIIKEIYDNTVQPIMSIDDNGREILIPIINNVVKNVDRGKRLITIEAPQGLIDIYLEEKE